MEYVTKEMLKDNTIVATDSKTSIARVARELKLELIAEYNDLYKIVNLTPITVTLFNNLLTEQNATIQKRVGVLHAEVAVINEMQ